MTSQRHHICVCVCTYKRPHFLRRLLDDLRDQNTNNLFTYSIVVSDNDRLRSAEQTVSAFAAISNIPLKYCVEPRQNIALARNMAIDNAEGDLVAFIDDDEFPTSDWLLTLFRAFEKYQVDGVLGPVKPHFAKDAPRWVVDGKFYERPTYPTGFVIDGKKGRTGNVLLARRLFEPGVQPFRAEFPTGEDQDFFGRMIAKGHVFVWCNEAVAYETVPPIRWRRTFMLRRALLRGATAIVRPTFGAHDVLKSLIAIPVYILALPLASPFGHHNVMILLVKLFDHLGKLLALVGIRPIKEQYITD